MNKSFYPFLFIVLAIFIALSAPDLFADGMFMDGLIYASVAKNLAHGEGSFWFLHFSDTYFSDFHEHPPLVFGIQSLFYKIFGDSILIEKLFSFGTYVITGVLIVLIWQEITCKKYSSISWLPLLLWIPIPLVHWGAVNNMLENTMSIFVCLSVLFTLKSLTHKRYLYLILSGFMLFCAFLSKGFTGLFPLSFPFWIWCFKRIKAKTLIIDTIILTGALLLPLVFIYFFSNEGIRSLQNYLDIQVFRSIQEIKTVNSRFYIVGKLFTELLIPIGLVIAVFIFGKKEKIEFEIRSWIFILFALGLSGVLPIMVSQKQNGFYILCTLPFFAIVAALIISGKVKMWVDKINIQGKGFRVFRIISVLFLAGSISIALLQKGKIHQHVNIISDVKLISTVVPPHSTVNVPSGYTGNWSMHGYFQRYAGISILASDDFKEEYLVADKTTNIPIGYEHVALQSKTLEFTLYKYSSDKK